ncbi:NADP-dependent oxidoreductase [Actinorhabdospora filicis]|uniref:NADP-dependent oxidoreductase n=1 Tax=Actinorhabdospora filicis TaxID=1785913 RepID=A0A9W6W890_9ACTN|nr:NADP-dependent oxidoreductase [Actinorhabdospora filicis]GLZ76733.1 NADP-dependent oxidoreductase [Actinorhabdospora filicis]
MTNTSPSTTTEIRLARHVTGDPSPADFSFAEVPVTAPGEGEVLVRTDYLGLSVAYLEMMREDTILPIPPWRVGDRVGGGGVGTVVASGSPDLAVGDLVQTMAGWTEYSTGPASAYPRLDRDALPTPVHHLSQGTTAFYGMAEIAKVTEGDVVFVSGAAGGVGSLAGQIAERLGAAKVIGSAGGPAKVAYLVDELGFDAAFDYRDGSASAHLRRLAPEGITVFFDNVGGEQYAAALDNAVPGARFALCGSLSTQIGGHADRFPEPDAEAAAAKDVTLLPFSTWHTPEQVAAWKEHFAAWLREGFVFPHTVVDGGLAAVPDALVSLLGGAHRGNVSVRF